MAHQAEEGELRIASSDLVMILMVVASRFAAAAASVAPGWSSADGAGLAAVASSAPGGVGLHMDGAFLLGWCEEGRSAVSTLHQHILLQHANKDKKYTRNLSSLSALAGH